MTDDRAAQEIAAAAHEPALAGMERRARLDMEVLGVGVERVAGQTADGLAGILVGAVEIAHVNQGAEVGVPDSIHQLLDPLAVLAEEPMVLDHRPDPLGGRVLGDGAAPFGQAGQGIVETARADGASREAGRGIVAHAGGTQDRRDVDLALDPLAFRSPFEPLRKSAPIV